MFIGAGLDVIEEESWRRRLKKNLATLEVGGDLHTQNVNPRKPT